MTTCRIEYNGEVLQQVALKDVKTNDFFKRKPDAKKVFTKGAFDRTFKKYSCDDWKDISRDILLKGSVLVYTGFSF